MNKVFHSILLLVLIISSCTTHYEVVSLNLHKIVIDTTYEKPVDPVAAAFISPYKKSVDSLVGPVVGHTAHSMISKRPESDLSNLLSDILIWSGRYYNEKPDFAVYNMGGIRASLSKGTITYGDILEVSPFENKVCFFDISGKKVKELFKQIALNRGEGVSHGVELVINKDGELLSAKLNGKEINENSTYRVVSIDYLAQGNDGLLAFKDKTNVNSPIEKEDNLRFIIINYFKEKEKIGELVDSKIEGRITVK